VSGKLYFGQAAAPGVNTATPVTLASLRAGVMADFDFNGNFDLFQTQSSATDITLSLGTGSGLSSPVFALQAPRQDGSFGAQLGPVGDFNGDGLLDTVVWLGTTIYVYDGAGTGTAFSSTPAQTYTWYANGGVF
jgi:hypothetical protein